MTLSGPLLRDHALRFEREIDSTYDAVEKSVDLMLERVVGLRNERKQRVRDISSVRRHLKLIMLNLYTASISPPYVYRAISLRAPEYSQPLNRYQTVKLSVKHIRNLIEDLTEANAIEVHRGYFDRSTNRGQVTRMKALPVLLDLMANCEVDPSMVCRKPSETIVMRDSEGRLVDYEDTSVTKAMRNSLALINERISQRRIHLAHNSQEYSEMVERLAGDSDRAQVDMTRTNLHRVFNNSSWLDGGRFYGGWWQGIPSESRRYIEIDHGMTVEIDYSGMHIRMLYAEKGLVCPDDPYDLPKIPREHQKAAILRIINAQSFTSAIASLRRVGIPNPRELCREICRRHSAIKDCFGTGAGVRLQCIDSQIAEKVMLKVIALGGIALPVHDSFIVRSSRADELKEAMEEAFMEIYPNAKPMQKRGETLLDIRSKEKLQQGDFFEIESTELNEREFMDLYERSLDVPPFEGVQNFV